jgi:GR25 family glycosyltransferase involved in LPS biosynthesis
MLVAASRRSWILGGTLLFAATVTVTYLATPSGHLDPKFSWHRENSAAITAQSGTGASNDTLGFGAIYVLTENTTTWRVQGLIRAANYTGLQLGIPIQSHISDEEVFAHFGSDPSEGYGHARALLNHLSVLETFIQSTHETALIVEDDVDFGINIRSQMSLISEAFWNHSKQVPETPDEKDHHPYLESTWDIFWPGHFGMQFADGAEVFHYTDPHALPWKHLTCQFNNYYSQMAAEEGPARQQLVFNSAPLATFAYAITRSHAAKFVEKLRRDLATKFDNALHIDCKGLAQRCVAPVPQVFHHHQVAGEKSLSSEEGRKEEVAKDLKWYMRRHKWTYNIEWSARCNALEVGEGLEKGWSCGPGKYDEMM